jgi:hypothetical protein
MAHRRTAGRQLPNGVYRRRRTACGQVRLKEEYVRMQKIQQIFIGCPFVPAIRKNYDKLKQELENETPLHLILADTTAVGLSRV